MSQLIQLKQRIKAIQVIKKITHAMRLISMSSRLKMIKQSENLELFRQEITPILCSLEKLQQLSQTTPISSPKKLLILIGSEKGLCGNFNSIMFSYFQIQLKKINPLDYHFITIGKQAGDFLTQQNIKIVHRYDKLSPNHLEKTASQLYEYIIKHKNLYETISCFYNHSKTFFIQEPIEYQLLPVQPAKSCSLNDVIDIDEYHWAQSQEDVLACIFQSFLKLNILYILSQSIISEQSARFLSMDSSTRNADNLLKKMQLEYNKIRQAKITRELTELISSF